MSGLAYRHQRVQRLRRLLGRRSARKDEGCFVIEGANLLAEALSSPVPIEAVFVDAEWARAPGPGTLGAGTDVMNAGMDGPGGSNRLAGLLERCFDTGARVFELEPGVLARVGGTVTPQPVMAVLQTPIFTMADIAGRRPQLVVVCIDVRDPGNAGTVARSAWAAGADAVVCCEGTVDLWNPKAVRSSAGAVLHVPIVAAGAPVDVLDEIGSWGVKRWGTACDGGADYATADLSHACALVVGNEAAGLPLAELRQHLDGRVSIPMPGGAGSLNVGMAAAVLCFEVARQRRHGAAVLAVPPTGDGLGPISKTGSGLGPISQTGSGRGATADTGTGPGIALPTGAGH